VKATLYEALGISPAASDGEVRTALRRQIRKYYAKTRDGHGNVEEALRFINHASRILSDPQLRANYDHELAVSSSGTLEERIAHVVTTAVLKVPNDRPKAAGPAGPSVSGASGRKGVRAAGEEPPRKPQHPGLTAPVARLRGSTSVAISLCVLFGVLISAAIVLVTPPDAVLVAKQMLVWLTLSLLALTVVYGVVHGYAWRHRRHPDVTLPRDALGDPAILNWRRDKSVFLGTSQPQDDAGWVFQLRMAELERAKSRRTSEPRPWNRLGARLFDYALWGLILAVPLGELQAGGFISAKLAAWLVHPLVAPVVITASWIPVEALLIAVMHTTPGKWLFGVILQFAISDAYASHSRRTRLARAAARGVRVWSMGLGCGFPLLVPITIAIAYERVAADQETPWDSAGDCLVTHVPAGYLNMLTGAVGLAAMLWLYGVAWNQTMADSIIWARTSMAAKWTTPPALLERSIPAVADLLGGAPGNRGASVRGDQWSGGVESGPRTASLGDRASSSTLPIDPDLAELFAERKRRLAYLGVEGPRMLESGNWQQATELCGAWANLDLDNAQAWACFGRALQAQGHHREAVRALRKAKHYDPSDGTIDTAINRSQRGIVADFLSGRSR
jgi:hypothetical protein